MQSNSQAHSKLAKQPCSSRESSGDMLPNAAIAGLSIPSIPGLSVEQVTAIMTAVQIAMDQAFDQHFSQQPNPTSPTPPPTQPNSLAKKKRNQKTRKQYKKKAQAQAQRVTSQVQEVDSVQIGVEKPGKHVVLQCIQSRAWDWVATSPHAVILYVEMTSLVGMIMVQNGAIWRPRMGVG